MKRFQWLSTLILIFSILTFSSSVFAQDNYNDMSTGTISPAPASPAPSDQSTMSTAPASSTSSDQSMTTSTPSTAVVTTSNGMGQKFSATDQKMAMRKLWEDHIVYTRNFIISTLSSLPDTNAVTNRLLKNQDDIGDAIKPFYGNDAGGKLAQLLRQHILIAAKVVKAAKANNKAALEKAQAEWTANAAEIATFLSQANPNWNKNDLQANLQTHLDLTTKETSARINKNWTEDISAYDDNHDHMLVFSDTLTDGIAKQFPDKFSN